MLLKHRFVPSYQLLEQFQALGFRPMLLILFKVLNF